jgi:hypothetical protein
LPGNDVTFNETALIEWGGAFEALHAALLHKFNLIRAINLQGRPIPVSAIDLTASEVPLPKLGDALKTALDEHAMKLPASVYPSADDRLAGVAVASFAAVHECKQTCGCHCGSHK